MTHCQRACVPHMPHYKTSEGPPQNDIIFWLIKMTSLQHVRGEEGVDFYCPAYFGSGHSFVWGKCLAYLELEEQQFWRMWNADGFFSFWWHDFSILTLSFSHTCWLHVLLNNIHKSALSSWLAFPPQHPSTQNLPTVLPLCMSKPSL